MCILHSIISSYLSSDPPQAFGLRIATVRGDGNCFFVRLSCCSLVLRPPLQPAWPAAALTAILAPHCPGADSLPPPGPQHAACDQLEGKAGDHAKLRRAENPACVTDWQDPAHLCRAQAQHLCKHAAVAAQGRGG